MTYILILSGLALLFLGGEGLVRGSVGLARRFGVSELLIGLTLVGFGTSMPELVTSLRAVSQGAVGMSVGNVAGSNIANVLLVLGAAALIRPIFTNPRALSRDFGVMAVATGLFVLLAYFDVFTRPIGLLLVALLLIYVVGSFFIDRRAGAAADMHSDEADAIDADDALSLSIIFAVGGAVGVVFGARFLVSGGINLAVAFGISDTVIGLTIVAIGTSLPELATSVVSALRGKSDVALGNILGSNIFNALGIVGATAAITPFSLARGGALRDGAGVDSGTALRASEDGVASALSWTDISTLVLSVGLVALFALTGRRLGRWEGGVLLGAYCLYMGLLFQLIPTPFA